MSKRNHTGAIVNQPGGGAASGGTDGVADQGLLFKLYLARVAKAETVQTVRRDIRAIFRDALAEAKVALEVYLESGNGGK